ncbi:MAG TPA: hypothetical protein PKB01_04925 [Xanthobacteraceae bacterium]|nr:hypothetical protein [Xanthobacteraceae bacterium]
MYNPETDAPKTAVNPVEHQLGLLRAAFSTAKG